MTSTYPTVGQITDMEDMTLIKKIQYLREHKVWKCMNKTEVHIYMNVKMRRTRCV